MGKGQIVYRAKEIICLHCGERQALKSTNFAEWREECAPFEEEHKGCRKQELGKMTFEEWFEKWWGERTDGPYKSINVESIARAAWEAAQPKWQPIETAPKDLGDRIEDFVLLSESGDVIHGGWCEEIDGEGAWFDRLYGEPIDDERITHWMLLPRPPKELEE